MAALGRTAQFYKDNPKARLKKAAYDKVYDKRPERRARRSELVKINREADKKGIDRKGKDYDHAKKRYVKASVNRGRNSKNGGGSGDIKSRG